MWGMRRIQFYSLKLGRHHNQKEEALCFMYVLSKWAVVYQLRNDPLSLLPQVARHSSSLSITTSSTSSRLLVWCLLFFFPPLLITLCTQLTQIKEQLQSRSRKLDLKGLSLFLPLSLFFPPPSNSSGGEPGAERGHVCPRRAVPSSPSLFASRRSSAEKTGLMWWWVSKATEKRSTFHPRLVSVMLSVHTVPVYCANL